MNKQDFSEQLKQWEISAKSGDAEASLLLGSHFHDTGNMETAFRWYLHASEQDNVNPIVFFYLGYAYQYGEGTPCDMLEAFVMYKKAVKYDVPQAFYSLAYFYQNGIVVPRDEFTAAAYMKQATLKMDMLFLAQYDKNLREEKLRTEISLKDELAVSLRDQNDKLLKEAGQLSEQIVQAQNKLTESDNNKKELIRQYDKKLQELRDQAAELQKQISSLSEQNSRLCDELQEKSEHETELWKEIAAKDKGIQDYMKQLGEYENLVSESNLRLVKCSNSLESAENEVEKLARTIFKMTYWIDKYANAEFANQSLSVFSKFSFTIDEISCISIESFLQALKFKNAEKQKVVCDMPPDQARKLGSRKKWWKRTGNLWWNGKKIKRSGSEYQELLNRVFDELYKNNDFTRALMNCGDIEILQKADDCSPQKVLLSEDEFVSRLFNMRALLSSKISTEETDFL